MPSQTVTNISTLFSLQRVSFALVRTSEADSLMVAKLLRSTFDIIMNSAAGMPLPLTSAITRQR